MNFLEGLLTEGANLSVYELIAVLTSLIYLLLATRGNRWCFPFGFMSSAIYVWLCYAVFLYFDAFINAYYVIMSVYGWYSWKNKTDSSVMTPHRISKKAMGLWLVAGAGIGLLSGFIAYRFSDASLPFLDAMTTIFAFIATYLLAKRVLQNWIIWIAVDFASIGLYYYKAFYLTSLLFMVYTIAAIIGYIQWKKLMQTT